MTDKTVLVTGAGGFIGSNLVDDQLERGRTVIALDLNLDRLSHVKTNPSCELVLGDVRNGVLLKKIVSGVDIIFHLASAHLEVSKSESYFWKINVDAVKNLLQIANNNGVRRFVHCSSVGVYGPLEKLPADENTECHPDIVYEKTKLEGEKIVRRLYEETQLSTVILRPAWVYGPRCPRTLKLFRALKKKRFLMVGKGKNYRHPIYIGDMLQALELGASKSGIEGETFVIASEKPAQLHELVEEIIQVQHIDFRPITIPVFLMWPVCAIVERLFRQINKEPPFSTRSLKFFTESSAFDISKARAMLGFEPAVSLKEGLTKTYEHNMAEHLL